MLRPSEGVNGAQQHCDVVISAGLDARLAGGGGDVISASRQYILGYLVGILHWNIPAVSIGTSTHASLSLLKSSLAIYLNLFHKHSQ